VASRADARLVPISFISTFAGFSDMVKGQESNWAHSPAAATRTAAWHGADDQQGNEGMGSVPRFLDAEQLTKDVTAITERLAARIFRTS